MSTVKARLKFAFGLFSKQKVQLELGTIFSETWWWLDTDLAVVCHISLCYTKGLISSTLSALVNTTAAMLSRITFVLVYFLNLDVQWCKSSLKACIMERFWWPGYKQDPASGSYYTWTLILSLASGFNENLQTCIEMSSVAVTSHFCLWKEEELKRRMLSYCPKRDRGFSGEVFLWELHKDSFFSGLFSSPPALSSCHLTALKMFQTCSQNTWF